MVTTVLRYNIKCIGSEKHGEHGVYPPLKDIEGEVHAWIRSLSHGQESTIVDNNDENADIQKIEYRLQVEARRIPVGRDFFGVKCLRIPRFNENILELRVRPRGSTYQWQVYFVPTIACLKFIEYIICCSNPTINSSFQRYFKEDDLLEQTYSNIKNKKLLKELLAIENKIKEHLRNISSNGTTKKLCYAIKDIFDDDGLTSKNNIRRAVSDFLNFEIPQDNLFKFLGTMMGNGLIEPFAEDNDDILRATIYFDELVEEAKNDIEAKEQEEHTHIVNHQIKSISCSGTIKKFCCVVNDLFDENGLILSSDLHVALSEFLDYNIQSDEWNKFITTLIDHRIIESDDNEIFHKTETFDKYVKQIRDEKLAKQIQQIDREIGDLIKERDKIKETIKSIWKQLSEQRQLWRGIEKEIRTKKKNKSEISVG